MKLERGICRGVLDHINNHELLNEKSQNVCLL